MPKKKKEKEESKMLYLRTASIEDICRYACRFDFTSGTLILEESKQRKRLIAFGERVGETQIAYYATVNESGSIAVYEPAADRGKDRVFFTSRTELPNKYYLNIMRAELGSFTSTNSLDKNSIKLVKVQDVKDLIGAAIRKAAKDETIANVYSFISGGKRVFAAFDVLEALANGKSVFYYSISETKAQGNFARYDYRSSMLDFADTTGDHSYLYAKIINLAEAFPFFKQ